VSVLAAVGAVVAVGYVPGAMLYRWPTRNRDARAGLPPEERVFWIVLTSLAWSTAAVLVMAALSFYTLERLVILNLAVGALALLTLRGRLRLGTARARAGAGTIAAVLLVALCGFRFTPAAEYVIGGKDPGVYVNEGIRLARTGVLFARDADVAAVPPESRDLFFPRHTDHWEYYGNRFMGIFLDNPDTGLVVPQFPHVYPASIALGYGIAGTQGATHAVAVWATLGVLAVFFAGARFVGRLPAFVAALLLTLNVAMTWYGRYPNAEVVMLALVFGLLLAHARATEEGLDYFAWTAAAMAALLVFLRFDSFIAIACLGGVAALRWIVDGRVPPWRFWLPAIVSGIAALAYYAGPMKAYFEMYRLNLPTPATMAVAALVGFSVVLLAGRFRSGLPAPVRAHLPTVLAVGMLALAAYALFARQPVDKLTDFDAYALRTVRDAYLYWPALLLALAGLVLVARPLFWRDPALVTTVCGFAVFFFYKIRIVPEQFWMARRFLPIIIPGALILASAAALGSRLPGERRTILRTLAGMAVLAGIAWQYGVAAAPVARHVEYAGATRAVARLAAHTTPDDLVIFESRVSDVHVFAVPLAYLYGRHVLVLHNGAPDHRRLEDFLAQARSRYARILFVAGAGTDLLSRRVSASPVAFEPVRLPEYETTDWTRMPAGPRAKDLGYNIYQLVLDGPAASGFTLDLGTMDDPYLQAFHARETTDDRTFRWTNPISIVSVIGLSGSERSVTFVISDGGRPAGAPPATVDVEFDGVAIGRIQVRSGFQSYTLPLPAEAVARAAQSADPVQLRLTSSVWSPSLVTPGNTDTRELGVMVDRIEIH
jgi:hypothetical protein